MKWKYGLFLFLLLGLLVFYFCALPGHSFADLYEGDPAIQASLEEFRKIPAKKMEVDGQDWNYYVGGSGDTALLFLHGMGGAYDIWWRQLEDLQQDYRVVALTYPPVPSLASMGRAVDQILEKEGIAQVIVIGSSLGGYLAQYLASFYPQRVSGAVFANTFPPNNILAEQNRSLGRLLPFLPPWMVLQAFRKNIRERVVPAAEDSPLVAAYLLEQGYGKMSKAQFYARYRCVIEYFETAVPETMPLLIFEADNDPLVDSELRAMLRAVYPQARIFTFQGKGHFPYLNDAEAYNRVLRSWLSHSL